MYILVLLLQHLLLSRIKMSIYKNNPDIKIYYTDTDSAFVSFDSKIDPKLIGPEIAQLKLEYNFNYCCSS